MKKYEIVDIPGLGDTLICENWFFGFKEVVNPDKEILYYTHLGDTDGEDIRRNRGPKNKLRAAFYGTLYGGIFYFPVSAAGDIAAASVMGTMGLVGAAYLGEELFKYAGRYKAISKIKDKIEKGEFKTVDMDFSSLDKIIEDGELLEKYTEYKRMFEKRQDKITYKEVDGMIDWTKRKPWWENMLESVENDEIMEYRRLQIAPIFESLENECKRKMADDMEHSNIFKEMSKDYGKIKKELMSKRKARRSMNIGIREMHDWYRSGHMKR